MELHDRLLQFLRRKIFLFRIETPGGLGPDFEMISALGRGLSTHAGQLTSEPVAEAHGLPYTPASEVLN